MRADRWPAADCRARSLEGSVGVEVRTPAKLNLFLEVRAKRADGFHEIETLMVPVDLYDTLILREQSGDRLTLACSGPAVASDLPLGSDNLVIRALELVRQAMGEPRGAQVQLFKRIPSAAGMAGGSSDAAAALLAANHVWQAGLSLDTLADLAAQLGSDIPFFLHRGAALCTGRGEQIAPLGSVPGLDLVVVCPPEGLATARVFSGCRPSEAPQPSEALIEALRAGRRQQVAQSMFNGLQESAAGLSPWIGRLADAFSEQDVLGHSMSGSGTSYFAVCRHQAHARCVAARTRGRRLGSVYVVRSC